MKNTIKVLLFDIDGVLVNSEAVHLKTWQIIFERHGLELTGDGLEYLVGRPGEDVADWLTERLGLDKHPVTYEQILKDKRQLFLEIVETDLEPVAGIDAFLREMAGRYRLGVVTSARLNAASRVLARFGWRDCFEVFIGAEHVTRAKPDPQPYQKAMEQMSVDPAQCLVFEDSTVGVKAAQSSGAHVCAMATSFSAPVLRQWGADWVARDFEDRGVLDNALAGRVPSKWSKLFRRLRVQC